MVSEQIEKLLSNVSEIQIEYEKNDISSGERFNVFSILGLTTNEVRTHSKFIAELLNPKGKHGGNDIFLKLFLNELKKIKGEISFQESEMSAKPLHNIIPEVEKWVGYIDKDYTEGGYIDIYIPLQNFPVIIENKIHAGDQNGQLRRYHNWNKKARIVYLTLDGREAENFTTKNEENPNDKIFPLCISYRETIINWLEECSKEAVNLPLVKETIIQYKNLIKLLTNQTMNDNLKNELVEAITNNPQFIKSAEEIEKNWDNIKTQIILNLKPKIREIAKELEMEVKFSDEVEDVSLGDKNSGFWFFKKDWCYCIYFYFSDKDQETLLVGVDHLAYEKNCSEEITQKLKSHFKDFYLYKDLNYSNWIWVSCFTEWGLTSWHEIQELIPNAIKETTKHILGKLSEFQS